MATTISRKERESKLVYAIACDGMKYNIVDDTFKESIITNLEQDWCFLYDKIVKEGWQALSDLHIDLLYQWAVDGGYIFN